MKSILVPVDGSEQATRAAALAAEFAGAFDAEGTLMHVYEPPEQFNLADHFLEQRLREGRGDAVALIDDQRRWTYAEVSALAHRFGHVFRGLGVRQEERVMIAVPDSANFAGAFFGALKIGAVVVMVNPDLKRREIAELYDYVRPSVVVLADPVRRELKPRE